MILSSEEEELLAVWIKRLSVQGLGRTEQDICSTVQQCLNAMIPQPVTKFKDNKPGKTWLKNFLNRHPDIIKRKARLLVPSRAGVSRQYLEKWFREVENNFQKSYNIDIRGFPPSQIFNTDQSGFGMVGTLNYWMFQDVKNKHPYIVGSN